MPKINAPYALAILAILIWGAMPAATEVAVQGIDPTHVAVLRTMIPALFLLPLALVLRYRLPADPRSWLALLISAIGAFVGFPLLFTRGIELTTSHAALILAAAPVFTGILGFIMDRKWPRWIWWLGAAIAMAGELVLILSRGAETDGAGVTIAGDLFVLLSVISVSASYIAGGYSSAKIGAKATAAWSMSIASLFLLPIWIARIGQIGISVQPATLNSWIALLYLALFASLIGYVAWIWAIEKLGVAKAAPIQFVQPLVSLVIAIGFLGEVLTVPIVIAAITILAGVTLTRRAAT